MQSLVACSPLPTGERSAAEGGRVRGTLPPRRRTPSPRPSPQREPLRNGGNREQQTRFESDPFSFQLLFDSSCSEFRNGPQRGEGARSASGSAYFLVLQAW